MKLECTSDLAEYIVDRFGGDCWLLSPRKVVNEITEMTRKMSSWDLCDIIVMQYITKNSGSDSPVSN